MTTEESVALAERHHATFLTIQGNAIELTRMAWESMEDYTSPEALGQWTDLWLPISDGAVDAAMVATDAYFAMATGTDDLGAGGITAAGLRRITEEVYARRPLATVYTALSKGALFEDALKAGMDRAVGMVAADASMGQRDVANQWADTGRIVGYRRTLTGASCGLCAVASTQRYTRGNLMPIHPHCDCGVAEIKGEEDPGHVLNQPLLDELRRAGPRYWDRPYGLDEDGQLRKKSTVVVRDEAGQPVMNPKTGKPKTQMALGDPVYPQVRNHGEMGRVLWAPGDHFLGPNDLN